MEIEVQMEPREERIEIHDDHPGQGYDERIKNMKEILDRPIFHQIFLICCVVAASIDPLFFYIPIIDDQKKCLGMDKKLKKTVLTLRSVMDLTYIFHIAFQFFYSFLAYALESRELLPRSNKVIHWIGIKGMIWRINWRIIIIDLLCVLPIPQVVILVCFPKMKGPESLNWRKIFNVIILFQFVPRNFRIYHSRKELTKNVSPSEIISAAYVRGLFNFFLYISSSHVTGAFWYFFSVQRESACWHQACKRNPMCDQSTFFCEHRYDVVDDPIIAYLNQSCPLIPPSRFDLGMYTPAIQSGIVNSMDFPRKFFYCFAWGLRNLSSFGSNLQTSTYFWENFFSASITVIGLLLFIYLIGNLQTYLQFSANYSENRRRKMEKKEGEIDEWIKSNEIPRDMGKELKYRVRQKMDENEDVNLKNLVNVLPNQSKKRITRLLCSHILEKVARLKDMDVKLINEIFIDHLKPVVFNKGSKIFKEREPLEHMLFFTQGSASVYSTDRTTPFKLHIGGLYGEELLEWALTAPSSPVPVLQKTVKTKTKVEAFAVDVQDMKKIAKSWPCSSKEKSEG